MSRKQGLYKEILRWTLPTLRNGLSRFRRLKPLLLIDIKQQQRLRNYYLLAEFSHNIHNLILKEDFVDQDVYFLNAQAHGFFKNANEYCEHYSLLVFYIQELFKEVPEHLRHKLTWQGPEGDWSWARPTQGGKPVDL